LKAAGEGVPRLEQKITELTRQIEASVRNTGEKLATASRELTRNLQDSHSEMQKVLTQSAVDVHKGVNSHLQQLSIQIKDQVVALDRALTEELTRSIRTLGEHLTALSGRFVEDYTPLTERLRSLTHLVT
jgi:DNA anti-recombination protein RmuC